MTQVDASPPRDPLQGRPRVSLRPLLDVPQTVRRTGQERTRASGAHGGLALTVIRVSLSGTTRRSPSGDEASPVGEPAGLGPPTPALSHISSCVSGSPPNNRPSGRASAVTASTSA